MAVTSLENSLRRAVDDIRSLSRPFALVGGLAVSTRTEPRFTRDADFALAVADDADAEAVIRQMRGLGYVVQGIVEQEAVRRLATVRMVLAADESRTVVDLLFASSGIEPEIVADAEELLVLPKFMIPVATVAHLIVMKLLARDDRRRPADADDLRSLATVATATDWMNARRAATQVVERGFNRGRDLVAALDAFQNGEWLV
jgi:predicted nucleotidyltransferase